MKRVGVAILGLGTVGGGTYKILTENHDKIMATEGLDVQVVKILERTREQAQKKGVPDKLIATNIDEIASNPDIDIVVEVIGGVEPAKTYITKCLSAGKNVVTANKELISKHWASLEQVARENNVGLYFEASCVGGVPIIRALTEGLQANNIVEIMGIFNGTTNYILTKMSEENMDYDAALKEAQALGYAEADPTNDVEGYDTMFKLSILSSIAFNCKIPINVIFKQGISEISKTDIENAKELGYAIKLLAIGRKYGNSVEVRVHPTFVPLSHPLAAVRGSFNAVHLEGDYVGDLMLYGKGAGDLPTGSAVVSDIVFCARQKSPRYYNFLVDEEPNKNLFFVTDFSSKYYMVINCLNKPGVLAKISAILGDNNVSIDTIIQRSKSGDDASVLFLTHLTSELSMANALLKIKELDIVNRVESIIRVI